MNSIQMLEVTVSEKEEGVINHFKVRPSGNTIGEVIDILEFSKIYKISVTNENEDIKKLDMDNFIIASLIYEFTSSYNFNSNKKIIFSRVEIEVGKNEDYSIIYHKLFAA